MGITPSQPVESVAAVVAGAPRTAAFLDEYWSEADAAAYGLTRAEFDELLIQAGEEQNFGLAGGAVASASQRAAYFSGLKVNELALARACAAGNERAWERFVALYHEPLTRAAIAMTGSETLGRELAGNLYAELYGMTERDGKRRCPLASYRGRGSLMGWLRTTLAQRHVDHHRKTHREEPLVILTDEGEREIDVPAPEREELPTTHDLEPVGRATEVALARCDDEERFLLAAYYLDGRTLKEIAGVLGVHEATVSRKVRRLVEDVRKEIVRGLQRGGLSRRAAEEAMGADPRDVDVNLRKLLQSSAARAFQGEEAAR